MRKLVLLPCISAFAFNCSNDGAETSDIATLGIVNLMQIFIRINCAASELIGQNNLNVLFYDKEDLIQGYQIKILEVSC